MRILYLYQYFVTPSHHGMTRAYEFARRLIDMGHEVKVVTSPGYLPDEYKALTKITEVEIDGVPALVIPVAYSNYMSFSARIGSFLRFAFLASITSMRTPVDVIYASSGPLTIALPGIAASLWQRKPLVFEVRDLWPELPIAIGAIRNPLLLRAALTLEWVAYHASRHIVALSPGMAEGIMRRGIAPERITVIPNSSDVDLFDVPEQRGVPIRQQLGLTPDQPLVVYAGSFGLMNNVSYLVDLAVEMRAIAPDVRFLMIGAGAEFEKVTAYAQSRGVLDDTLHIWLPRPKLEVVAILSAATVATSMFLPVREMWNNSANKFFDALAAGRPIVINYGGWQEDILREYQVGIRIPYENVAQAARELADYLHSPERLMTARQAAHDLAYGQFHRDAMAQKLAQVLSDVTGA